MHYHLRFLFLVLCSIYFSHPIAANAENSVFEINAEEKKIHSGIKQGCEAPFKVYGNIAIQAPNSTEFKLCTFGRSLRQMSLPTEEQKKLIADGFGYGDLLGHWIFPSEKGHLESWKLNRVFLVQSQFDAPRAPTDGPKGETADLVLFINNFRENPSQVYGSYFITKDFEAFIPDFALYIGLASLPLIGIGALFHYGARQQFATSFLFAGLSIFVLSILYLASHGNQFITGGGAVATFFCLFNGLQKQQLPG